MKMNRREFVAFGAAFACAGRAFGASGGEPALRVGVLSDIHVTKLENANWFEKALRKFEAERVDAVLVSGDLITWGKRKELEAVAETWRKVFPGDRRSDGAHVERLFVTGNHDVDGFAYAGAKFKSIEAARETGFFFHRDEMWRELFGEPYEPVKVKTVKGYSFVLRNWNSRLAQKYVQSPGECPLAAYVQPEEDQSPAFIAQVSASLPTDRPFFFVRHEPIPGTVVKGTLDATGEALAAFPNCIALSGHTHFSLTDEHSIWQGAFTAVNCSCARGYLFTYPGRENGFSVSDFNRDPPFEMPPLDIKRAKQGMVMDVWPDFVAFRRFDIVNDVSLGDDWVVPLCGGGRTVPTSGEAKYTFAARSAQSRPPQFGADAKVAVAETDDGRRRNVRGTEADPAPCSQIVVSFPPAVSTDSSDRGFDYSVTAEMRTADVKCVIGEKRVFSPGFCMSESLDTEAVTCAFARGAFPKNRDVRFIVRPYNCWARSGSPSSPSGQGSRRLSRPDEKLQGKTMKDDIAGQNQNKGRASCRGLSLMSGGLDSQLAVRVLQRAGAEVEGVCFSTPFFDCAAAKRAAAALGVKLHVVDFLDDEIALIKNPPHGFGGAMNPCIDCHATMIRRAGEMMERFGFDFVATGEVRGQRPMSQNAQSLVTVEKASGLSGRLVRPLSAKLLEPTIPEKEGLLDREKLLDLSGRGRERQIALAAEFGIVEYPSPAGGCKLTEAGFSRKLRDLMEHEGLDDRRLVELSVVARRFRLPDGTSVMLGRDQRENAILNGEKGVVIFPVNVAGPTALLPRVCSDADMELAKGIVCAYSRFDRVQGDVVLNVGAVPGPYDREAYRGFQVC